MTISRPFLIPASIATIVILLAGVIEAQISPVRIKVTKKRAFQQHRSSADYVDVNTGRKVGTAYSSVNYSKGAMSCQIAIVNNSAKSLDKVNVKWSILIRHAGHDPELLEGENTINRLDNGRTFQAGEATSNNPRADAKDIGYLVEVYIDGNCVASESDPKDIKPLIEEARRTRKD